MVIDEFAEEDFVHADLLGRSQLELDRCGRTESVAVTFAGRIRFSGCYTLAVGLGVICATRGR